MGTTCLANNDPRFSTNKGFYEAELRNQWNKNIKVLKVSFNKSTIYELLEKTNEDGKKTKFINTIKVSRDRKSNSICYKYISEDMGPFQLDCPVSFLKESNCDNKYAVEWRKKCFEYRKNQKEQKNKIEEIYKKMPIGTVVEMFNGIKVRVSMTNYSKKNWFLGYKLEGFDSEQLYRWKFQDIKCIVPPEM